VILDTKGNIFGGFTPVEWESRTNSPYEKGDDSQKSFLFTLKNPHNIPARKFVLKSGKKRASIYCYYSYGPSFGYGFWGLQSDFGVQNNCNANTESWTSLGSCYKNDTRLDGDIVFTGSHYFKVTEIEVFEITD
jgi:hypothetical protein